MPLPSALTMPTTSRGALWLLGAGVILTGWWAVSVVAPPSADTRSPDARSARPSASAAIPALSLTTGAARTPPTNVRNPFAFANPRSSSVVAGAPGSGGPADAPVSALVGSDAPEVDAVDDGAGWRLIGLAERGASGRTAVISGPGGVHLVTVGDHLPDGRVVLELGESTASIGGGSRGGAVLVLRLP